MVFVCFWLAVPPPPVGLTDTHAVSCEMRPSVLHLTTCVEPEDDVTLISGEAP